MPEKILIVDDDVQTLRLVGLMLERQGYKIIAANNGVQALRTALAERPDIIILDVMMPDMDGYEVTRRLRKSPETANTPILMFTARSQVEDKVTGYEAGVDDYLTKPIHPAELTAHLRALVSRRKGSGVLPPLPQAEKKGYQIGVVAAKGGLGVSTLTLNLAIAFQQKTKIEVIAAEMRPGQGTWSIELGNLQSAGLSNLLRLHPSDINHAAVENELVRMPYGTRLLMSSCCSKDIELINNVEQVEAVSYALPSLAKLVFLDIGTNYCPGFERVLSHCDEVIVATEPFPGTVHRTRQLIDDLNTIGFGRSKYLTVVNVNRIRADIQISLLQMQEILGLPIAQVIPPAPEVAYQAAMRNIPMIQVQIGSVLSQQFNNLADTFTPRVPA